MKKYFVYVLQSLRDNGYYVGFAQDIEQRLADHNAGKTRSLRGRRPLKLVHVEEYARKSEAKARERQIKSYKGGQAFRRLLQLASRHQQP
ncbi:MAG: GIY-YIG nuclease family protein [Terriglobia bacterium]